MSAAGTKEIGMKGPLTISIGMCAYNERQRIAEALTSVAAQTLPEHVTLVEVLVVASGCTDGTEGIVEARAEHDPRIQLIRERSRAGKASGINQILSRARGDVIVLLNADASLPEGSLAELLRPFTLDPELRVACGAPAPEHSDSPMLQLLSDLQWELHNRTLEALSARGEPNHCCDEFMAMRRGFIESIPPDLINDGAYIGAIAGKRGKSVLFCSKAPVHVETPRTFRGILIQRHRVLRGHRQVHDVLGRPANVLESLLFREPILAVQIVGKELLDKPSFVLAFLFLMVPLEVMAGGLAIFDRLRAVRYEPRWTTVE